MPLSTDDKRFLLGKVSLLDFKSIEMDRVLTGLFARIFHTGQDSRLKHEHTVDTFLEHFTDAENAERFRGFANYRDIVRSWLETDLLDLVNRGRRGKEKVAAPRPLHGYTYRFRNPKHCKDYGAAQHIYEMLVHTGPIGEQALRGLKSFFFEGIDQNTGQEDPTVPVDVETQALLSLAPKNVISTDAPAANSRQMVPPLCVGSARLLADDIIRLLQYRQKIPRSVMVEYFKILLAFHLGLYHLRLLKLLPELVRKKGVEPVCGRCPVVPLSPRKPQGDCPYQIGMFLDVLNQPGDTQNRSAKRLSELAEHSADLHYRRIPAFIRANFLTKKLDEWGTFLLQSGKLTGGTRRTLTASEVLGLLDDSQRTAREEYFGARLLKLTMETHEEEGAPDADVQSVVALGLDKFNTYIECLMALRYNYHRMAAVKSFDALFLKNRPGAMIAQTRTKNAARRFTLDSRLLEVLLQVAVMTYDGASGYYSEEIQVDRLLEFLRDRYGLYIDQLPRGEGFGEPTIEDRVALRMNKDSFKNKLREIGFFQELSDAYVTQHVTPRYKVGTKPVAPRGGAA